MGNIFLRKIKRLFQLIRLSLAGFYFDLFIKTYKNKGITLNIPLDETSLELKGTLFFNEYEADEAEFLDK